MPTAPATILLCTANSTQPHRNLQLGDELRAIEEALQRSRMRDAYDIRMSLAVSLTTLARELDDHRPLIVHFSGHGEASGELILKDDRGDEQPVKPEHIAKLLSTMSTPPVLVTFAACYSTELAQAAVEHADFAIGFDGKPKDRAMPSFSAVLYGRLAAHEQLDVPRAFEWAEGACGGLLENDQAKLYRAMPTRSRRRISIPTSTPLAPASIPRAPRAEEVAARSMVDALVITALPEELDALLEVTAGVVEPWTLVEGSGPPHHVATLEGKAGPVRIAAARLTRMGGVATAVVATELVTRLGPGSLAMCGVCAGRPEQTERGDVVIADRVFQHDGGKLTEDGFRGDLWVHAVGAQWLRASQDLMGPATGLDGYVELDDEVSRWWFLEQLLAGRNPLKCQALRRYVPDERRPEILQSIIDSGHVKLVDGLFRLTRSGRSAIENHRVLHGTRVTRLPYHIHVGPIGSGNAVVADGTIWARIAGGGQRKILALEMEAASIGQVAHQSGLPFAVIKGVMDHADAHKDDRFKKFSARASAEVLCRFLRAVVVPTPGPASPSTSGPEAGVEPSPLHDPDLLELVDMLAHVYCDLEQARVFLWRCGFPRERIPAASTSREFWDKIAFAVHNGQLEGGLPALGRAAFKDYKGNAVFRRYR